MAGDILGIGASGLLTSQRNLATTSHNISNVNTEGYSRQRTEQEARMPQYSGNGYIGTGVTVQTTVRLANEFLEEQVRNANSQLGQYDAYNRLSSQVDNIIANPDTGLTPTLENFYSALQEANDNPSSTPPRQVLITEANTLTDRFDLLDTRFSEINEQLNQDLIDFTAEVTDAARSIALLNTTIVQKIGIGQGDMPNDLLDQREVLIKTISENIDVSVIYQDDGSANLFIGSGQPLVVGSHSLSLATQTSKFNVSDLDVILIEDGTSTIVTSLMKGGELQGVLDFKSEVLDPARRSLGRIAIAVSEEMNAQHELGMTLQDTGAGFKLGDNFFTDLSGPISALGKADNIGEIEFNITDSRALTTSDYQLDFDGSYTLRRLSDGVIFSGTDINDLNSKINPPGTAPFPPGVEPQGFSILPPVTAPVSGDSFLIRPTYDASAKIDVAVNNVLDIALAAPIVSRQGNDTDLIPAGTTGSAVNSGSGEISLPSIGSLNNIITPPGEVLDPVKITLTYDGTNGFAVTGILPAFLSYTSADSGGKTYVFDGEPPLSSDFGGMSFTITGVPAADDIFVIENNSSPFNDNRNGLLMSKLQTTKTLENGSTDFQAGYSMIVSDVGTKTRSSSIDLLAQQTLSEQVKAERESYSGVNLDEEATDLLKFQQAYQASARVISSADEMFQTLINAV